VGAPSEYVRELIRQDKAHWLSNLGQELAAAAKEPAADHRHKTPHQNSAFGPDRSEFAQPNPQFMDNYRL